MATIEETEITLAADLGDRWWGPTVTTASKKANREGQVRRAWYQNGILEEVTCQGPGSPMVQPETWPINTNDPFRRRPG